MGKIRIDRLPWTQPAFAPLYPAEGIPVLTRQRWHLGVVFEVDAEAVDAAGRWLAPLADASRARQHRINGRREA